MNPYRGGPAPIVNTRWYFPDESRWTWYRVAAVVACILIVVTVLLPTIRAGLR